MGALRQKGQRKDCPAAARRRFRLLRIAAAVCGVLVGIPLLAEGALWAWVWMRGLQLPMDYTMQRYFELAPYGGARPKPGAEWEFLGQRYRHNSLGTLGPEFSPAKPPDVLRIFTSGGSSSYVSDYPRFLEQYLNQKPRRAERRVEVVNLATPGATSRGSLLRLREYLNTQPDLVVYYEAFNEARLAENPALLSPIGNLPRGSSVLIPVLRLLPDRSLLYYTLRKAFGLAGQGGSPQEGPDPDRGPPNMRGNAERPGFHEDAARGPLDFSVVLPYYRGNLNDLIAESRQQGAKVLLATFAYLPFDEINYSAGIHALNQALRELPREGVFCVETAALVHEFPQVSSHFAGGGHFDPVFAEALARRIGEFVETNIDGFQPAETR